MSTPGGIDIASSEAAAGAITIGSSDASGSLVLTSAGHAVAEAAGTLSLVGTTELTVDAGSSGMSVSVSGGIDITSTEAASGAVTVAATHASASIVLNAAATEVAGALQLSATTMAITSGTADLTGKSTATLTSSGASVTLSGGVDGQVVFMANTSAGSVTVQGKSIASGEASLAVKIAGTWYVVD
jgi:hypothetical protein